MPQATSQSPGTALSATAAQRFDAIFDLLQGRASLGVLSEFLRDKQLPHSAGSWDDMKSKRLQPYLQRGDITLDELSHILNEHEEYGRGHTFLYQGNPQVAAQVMDQSHLEAVCQARGYSRALNGTEIDNLPSTLTLSQIRQEENDGHAVLTFKFVETRIYEKPLDEDVEDNILIKRFEYKRERAVNVVRLHGSGLLEIRIYSRGNTTKYENDVHAIRMVIRHFLTLEEFPAISFTTAKNKLVKERASLRDRIRFADATVRNRIGNKFSATTGPTTGDLYADQTLADGMSALLNVQGSLCESSGVAWKPVEGHLNREIKMLLSGLNNQFAITTNCTKAEYEYVLNELRRFNRQVSERPADLVAAE